MPKTIKIGNYYGLWASKTKSILIPTKDVGGSHILKLLIDVPCKRSNSCPTAQKQIKTHGDIY